jgi:single-strand DNA-binding protein
MLTNLKANACYKPLQLNLSFWISKLKMPSSIGGKICSSSRSPKQKNPKQKGDETMLNQCTLAGNLGAGPEVFYSSEGNPVASFSLAFRSSRKKSGWIKVVCFQNLAEVSAQYLHKGARIAVIGTLDHHRWETDEGIQKSSFQVSANSLEFIKTDGRGFEEGKTEDDIPF